MDKNFYSFIYYPLIGPGLDASNTKTLENLENVAISVAAQLAAGKLKVNREKKFADKAMSFALKYDFVKDFIFKKAKGMVMKNTNGLYPAPLKVTK